MEGLGALFSPFLRLSVVSRVNVELNGILVISCPLSFNPEEKFPKNTIQTISNWLSNSPMRPVLVYGTEGGYKASLGTSFQETPISYDKARFESAPSHSKKLQIIL